MRFFVVLAIILWVPSLSFISRASTRISVSPLKYANVEEQKDVLRSRLPPVDAGRMSKLETEFRELLEDLLFTSTEIESIHTPRMRAIYEGVAASYYEPAVYRAFEVLYEDYTPLRIAGRLVHQNLKQTMNLSKDYKISQIDSVLSATDISLDEAETCWSAFIRLAEDREISLERIQSYISSDYSLISNLQEMSNSGNLSYGHLVVAFSQTDSSSDVANILQHAQRAYHGESDTVLDQQRAKYNKRYDDMLKKFGEWKAFIPDGEGRRLDILKGCFVGSENPKVVEALRIIYTDYTALRLSGNWIFKVVSTIMGATLRGRKKQ